MINGAAEEHEKHAKKETDDTKDHLPTDIGSQPYQPDGTQGKDRSAKMRPRVAEFSPLGPTEFTI